MPMLSELSNLVWNGASQANESPKRPRIFALPAGFSGCAFWRYRLPFNKLKKIGSAFEIDMADNPSKQVRIADIQEHVDKADIISIQSPGYKDCLTLMKLYKSEGKKVVVDYDDYSFDLSEGNPRFAELGIEEKSLTVDGKTAFRWRDGENGFDLKSNREKFEAFKTAVAMADMVTTTTEYLADKFRKYNKNVAVCPNSIDLDLWRPIPRPESMKEIRIGWFGGDSHYVDLAVFKNLLPRLARKYPGIKVVIQGPMVPEWRDFFKGIPNLEWHGWADLRYYPFFLAACHFDIGLCPLADNEFNKCKSNIKALEFSAIGAAVVAQDMIPYSNYIDNGKTGLLAGSEDQWFDQISRLIEDKNLRETLAVNAFKDIQKNQNLDINCKKWEEAYLNLC